MKRFLLSVTCLLLPSLGTWLLANDAAAPATQSPVRVSLGEAVVALNGPWRFRTGDDPHWADLDYDDSGWEALDLTPAPGAHDSDVGLLGYVPGWQARGHHGYVGYAWYRIRVAVDAPQEQTLSLLGPLDVDGAYQAFVDGRLLGGMGDFSGRVPKAFSIHQPKIFPLPLSSGEAFAGNKGFILLAFRVWMGPGLLSDSESGGIHIAPSIGTIRGVQMRYELQWLQTIKGYLVDAVEAVLFVLLAALACSLIAFDRSNPAYLWMASALLCLAVVRGNQAAFFWGQFETLQGFELVTIVTFTPLCLATWTLTWYYWFRLRGSAWIPSAVLVLAALYMVFEFLRRSWFHGSFPRWIEEAARSFSMWTRLLFVLLTLLIAWRGMARKTHERWFVLPAILLMSVGLYARELSMLHVPGIWFPFGTGVSRTEYAYAAFDVTLFVLMCRRVYGLRQPPTAPRADSRVKLVQA